MTDKFTPGEWKWQSFDGGKTVFLGTMQHGRLIVMDFERSGMNGAAPRFSNRGGTTKGGIMRSLELEDIQNHPDAKLIAASPGLLEACRKARTCASIDSNVRAVIDAAIAKAVVG